MWWWIDRPLHSCAASASKAGRVAGPASGGHGGSVGAPAEATQAGKWPRKRYARRTMSNVVNLNRYRKKKARQQRTQQAEANRRLHSRTKAERESQRKQQELDRRKLDGHRLPPTSDSEPTEDDPNP